MSPITILIGILAVWTMVLLLRDRFAVPRFGAATIKFTHVLPSILQVALFAYWALHWPGVLPHLPVVGVQLLMAYAFDFLLAWTLRRAYRPSFGPLPIVLSMNLFVWLPSGGIGLVALGTFVAVASKVLIVSKRRHIFNPSVLGLAVIALLCISMPGWFSYRDISHDFDRPPFMAIVILLLALVPQIRLGTAPVALGAAFAMLAMMMFVSSITGYRGAPSAWWPPWLLTITLLAGDPATIPARSVSRLLFGLFLGVAFYLVSRGMLFSIGTDFFAKVLPIPLANALVPFFERAGTRLESRWPRLAGSTPGMYTWAWVAMSCFMVILPSLVGTSR